MQAPPFSLTLRDTYGGHPLDGGVLVFDIPSMTDANYRWTYVRYGMYVPEIRVTLAPVPGDSRACEVSMHVDLRRGLKANIIGFGVLASTGSGVGGVFSAVVASKAFALAGAALLGPVVGGVALCGIGCLSLAGVSYRWTIRKAQKELQNALAAIDTSMRAFDIFGDTPRISLTPKSGLITPSGGF